MKAVISVHRYDGGLYAVLTRLDGRATTIAESDLYMTWTKGVVEMRRYARDHNIEVMWTDTHVPPTNES